MLVSYERIFTNNSKYHEYKPLLFIDSLAYMVQEYLYSVRDPKESSDFILDGRLRFYDFMTLTVYIIRASRTELGKINVKEILENLYQYKYGHYAAMSIEYTKENALLVCNADYKLVLPLLWTAYVYASTRNRVEKNELWGRSATLLHGMMMENIPYKEEELKKLPPFKYTDDAIDTLINHIHSKAVDNQPKTTGTGDVPKQENAGQETQNAELEKRIAELEGTIESLRSGLPEIDARQKVRMELMRKIMEKAGIDEAFLQKKRGFKKKAGMLMSCMLGIRPETCQSWLSYRELDVQHEEHREAVKEINRLLEDLELDIRL